MSKWEFILIQLEIDVFHLAVAFAYSFKLDSMVFSTC